METANIVDLICGYWKYSLLLLITNWKKICTKTKKSISISLDQFSTVISNIYLWYYFYTWPFFPSDLLITKANNYIQKCSKCWSSHSNHHWNIILVIQSVEVAKFLTFRSSLFVAQMSHSHKHHFVNTLWTYHAITNNRIDFIY